MAAFGKDMGHGGGLDHKTPETLSRQHTAHHMDAATIEIPFLFCSFLTHHLPRSNRCRADAWDRTGTAKRSSVRGSRASKASGSAQAPHHHYH